MKFYPLNPIERALMSDVIAALRSKIERLDSLERLFTKAFEEDAADIDLQIEKWTTYADVIRVVAYEEEEYNRKTLMEQERGWNNGWDVPAQLFNEAFDAVISLVLEVYVFQPPIHKEEISKQVKLLQSIKEIRN